MSTESSSFSLFSSYLIKIYFSVETKSLLFLYSPPTIFYVFEKGELKDYYY
jgi:hypothetical protein